MRNKIETIHHEYNLQIMKNSINYSKTFFLNDKYNTKKLFKL